MITRGGRGRAGVTTWDVAIGIAVVTVALALVGPTLRARAFLNGVAETVGEVESMRTGAERYHQTSGEWPSPAPPGVIPPELIGAFGADTTLIHDGYALQWARWEVVDFVEAPPSAAPPPDPFDIPPDTVGPELVPSVREIGGVVLHAGDGRVLAELLNRYGPTRSFVRDTTWTLILSHPPGL